MGNFEKWVLRITILLILVIFLFILALPLISNYNTYRMLGLGVEIDKLKLEPLSDYISVILTSFSICFALAAIIPYIMSRFIIKSDINDSVEKLFKEQYDIELKSTIGSLEKADADQSRMNAFMLFSLGKPVWAIGWMSRSMNRYLRCERDHSPHQGYYNQITGSCIPMIIGCLRLFIYKVRQETSATPAKDLEQTIKHFLNVDNHEPEKCEAIRALSDLIDYRIKSKEREHKLFQVTETDEENKAITDFIRLLIKTLGLSNDEFKELKTKSWYKESFEKEYHCYSSSVNIDCCDVFNQFEESVRKVFENPKYHYTAYMDDQCRKY